MADFIEAVKLKFDADVESVVKNALSGRYSLDEIIDIVFLFTKCTENLFVDEEEFKATGHCLGLRRLFEEIHIIHYVSELYKTYKN